MSKKMKQKFEGQFNQQQQRQQQKHKEGETVIHKVPKNNSASNKKVGEYIDYEEID